MPAPTVHAISYGDVFRALSDVASTWDVRLQFVMGLTPQPCKGVACYVRLAVLMKNSQGGWDDVGGHSEYWPNPDAGTMTGLMLRMVYALDAKMQADHERDEARSSVPRQRTLF